SARKRLGHGFPWRSIAVVAVLVAGVVGAGILVAPLLSSRSSESKTDTLGWVSWEANFRLNLAREEWKENPDARLGLRAVAAVEKIDQEIGVAIATQDFGTRNARDAEMAKGAISRLEDYFKDGELEWEPRATQETLAGQPVQRLVFQGQHDNVLSRGECYLL